MASEIYQIMSLDDVADFRNGKAISPERYTQDGRYPVFGANGQIARSDDVLNTETVVAIGRVGAYCGSVHYIPEPSWVTDNAIVAMAKGGNNIRFLYYLFDHLELRRTAIGSAQPLMTQGGLKVIQTVIPPLKVQEAIACILGALDDKIELNRQMNRTLEDIARAIFKSWFVDFDPVRAKAAGHQPPGLKPEIAALFPDSFEDSELGEIPKGWRVRPIGEVVQVLGGGTPSTKESAFWEDGIHPFCTPKDMASLTDSVLLQTERHLTDEGLANVSSGQLPIGAVLLSSRAPIGYLAIAETPFSINQGIIAMVCDDDLPNLYVLHWTKTNMDRVLANANGSTFMEISKRNFRPITAVIPPPQVLRCFMQVVDPTHQRVVSSLKQIQHLADLRDSLLPKLISGDLAIAEADRIAERYV